MIRWYMKGVQSIHPDLVEIGDLSDVDQVNDRKVLHFLADTVEGFIHLHALSVSVASKPKHNHSIVFG